MLGVCELILSNAGKRPCEKIDVQISCLDRLREKIDVQISRFSDPTI